VIAITGASGYLGGLMCDDLARRGYALRRLVRRPDTARGDVPFALGEPVPDAALAGVETLIHAAYDFRHHRERSAPRQRRRLAPLVRRRPARGRAARALHLLDRLLRGSHSAYGG